MQKIESIEDLDNLLEEYEQVDCFISLNGIKSSKSIWKDDDKYIILNEVDDSEDILTKDELFDATKTNIGKAITDGKLYVYDYQFN